MNLLAETQRVQIAEMTKLHVGHVNQPNRLAAQCKKTYKYDSNLLIRVSHLTFTDYFVLEESIDDTASHIHSYVYVYAIFFIGLDKYSVSGLCPSPVVATAGELFISHRSLRYACSVPT